MSEDVERVALDQAISGAIPDDLPGYRQRYTERAIDAILAAGFHVPPTPLTTAQVNTILYRYDHPQDHPGGHYGVAEATRDLNTALTPAPTPQGVEDVWCRSETCTWRHWRSGFPTHQFGSDCPPRETLTLNIEVV